MQQKLISCDPNISINPDVNKKEGGFIKKIKIKIYQITRTRSITDLTIIKSNRIYYSVLEVEDTHTHSVSRKIKLIGPLSSTLVFLPDYVNKYFKYRG